MLVTLYPVFALLETGSVSLYLLYPAHLNYLIKLQERCSRSSWDILIRITGTLYIVLSERFFSRIFTIVTLLFHILGFIRTSILIRCI